MMRATPAGPAAAPAFGSRVTDLTSLCVVALPWPEGVVLALLSSTGTSSSFTLDAQPASVAARARPKRKRLNINQLLECGMSFLEGTPVGLADVAALACQA